MEDILVPIALLFTIIGTVTVITYFRFRGRQEMLATIRASIESGQTLSADVLSEIAASLYNKKNDLRRGMVYVAIGVAFLVLSVTIDDHEAVGPLMGLSAFPFFIGFAYLILWYIGRRDGGDGSRPL